MAGNSDEERRLRKAGSHPQHNAPSSSRQKAVYGAAPTPFENRSRGSPDSDIAGGSSTWDPFRNAMDDFNKAFPDRYGPAQTAFGDMSDRYHRANAEGKELKARMARLPQAEKDALKPEYEKVLRQEKEGREEMQRNWPGYDEWASSKGHRKRVDVLEKEIKKLQTQNDRFRAKMEAEAKKAEARKASGSKSGSSKSGSSKSGSSKSSSKDKKK